MYGHLHVYSGHFSYKVCLNIYALRLVDHAVFHQYAQFWVLPSDLKPNNGTNRFMEKTGYEIPLHVHTHCEFKFNIIHWNSLNYAFS